MTNFVQSFTLASERDNYANQVGVAFNIVRAVTVSQLGIRKGTGATGVHTVNLSSSFSGGLLASVGIDLTSATVGTFVYASITPVELIYGTFYLSTLGDSGGGQNWAESSNFTTTSTDFSNTESVYGGNPSTGSGWSNGTANQMFYGLDFVYTIAPPGTNRVSNFSLDVQASKGDDRISTFSTEVVLQPFPTNRVSAEYIDIVSSMRSIGVTNRPSTFYLEFITEPPVVVPKMKPYAMILG